MITDGQPIGEKNITKIRYLKKNIFSILSGQRLTIRELVNWLMGEPYYLKLNDLDLLVIALNDLNDNDHLRIDFRINQQKIDIDPVFRVV